VANESIAETRDEIERLRGIIEGARFFLGEDMPSLAAIILCGMGLEDGIDPALTGTAAGRALIAEGNAQRDVIEAAREWAARVPPHVEQARDLRAALEKLGDPR
jgi:hypothetical protein